MLYGCTRREFSLLARARCTRRTCLACGCSSSLLLDALVVTISVDAGTIINAAALWCTGGSLDEDDMTRLVIDVPLSSDEAGGVKVEGIAIKPLTWTSASPVCS